MNVSETDTTVRIGRLDMSDLVEFEEGTTDLPSPTCDWCGEPRGKEYMVLEQEKCDAVCTLCWGQSASYLTLREQGLSREEALARLGKQFA
jgi:hypothetical protein